MHKASRIASAASLAAYEGALDPSLFAVPAASSDLPLTKRHAALQTIKHLAGRAPAVVEDWVKVRKTPTGDRLWLAQDALIFLAALTYAGQTVGQVRLSGVDDPRLSAVFKHMSPFMGVQMRHDQVQHVLQANPWRWAQTLYKQLTPLIKLLSSRSQVEREVKHELKLEEKLRKMKSRLLALAKKHPDAVVLRLELYAPCPANVEHGEDGWAQKMASLARTWVEKLGKELDAQIVSAEMCPQQDGQLNVGIHAMVIVAKQPKDASIRLHEKAGEFWKKEAGAGSSYVICKGATLQVRYRGRLLNAEGDRLQSELTDAAAYFIYGGGPLPLVLSKPRKAPRPKKSSSVFREVPAQWERKW